MSVTEKFNRWWAASYPTNWWGDKKNEPLPVAYRWMVRDFASVAYLAGYIAGRVVVPLATMELKSEVCNIRITLPKGLSHPEAMEAAIDWYKQIEREWPDCGGFHYDEKTGIATVRET